MKILYHHRTLADGAEGIHITEMVEALQALGHEVVMHALTTSRRRGEGRPSAWGKLKAALPGPIFELGAIAFNLVDYVNFAAALRRHRPDLVYKRHALYDAGVALTCWRAKIPLVLEVNCPYSSSRHRTFEHVGFPRVAQWLERTAFSRATLVATVSSPLGELVHQISDGRARILVVPNGANPRRFTPQTAQPEIRRRLAPEGATLAGWVGILRPWHRVDLLLNAVSGLKELHLAIIGDGPDRPRLERLARELELDDRVCFTGRVPHEEMPAYIAALDIAISADDRTGYASPMKLLEYMAMAKPVIAPRLANIEDFIRDGVDGVLFAPGDAVDLRRALERLTTDVNLRERCGRNARLAIERDRNWEAIAQRICQRVFASPSESLAGEPAR